MMIKYRNTRNWIQTLATVIALFIVAIGLDPGIEPVKAKALAVIDVNTIDDELNEDGDCSLREAIRAANLDSVVDGCQAGSGQDTIDIDKGTFVLALEGIGEDEALTGDLDIIDDLTITGAGVGVTIIDGDDLDRVFHIVGEASVVIAGVTIRNGNASTTSGLFGGGGILNEVGDLEVKSSKISSSQAVRSGGGIDNAGSVNLVDVTISGNTSEEGGGIFNDGSLRMTNVTLNDNEALKTGGGLDNSGDSTLNNVTIDGNIAQGKIGGDGIFNDGNITVLNGTISGNFTVITNENVIRFKNTIVTGGKNNENCVGSGTFTSNGHNLDSGDTCNFKEEFEDITGTNPRLGDLEDNQGPTKTRSLKEGSPAIDMGDNVDCPLRDQRGASRPADGDEDGTEACDIGAFEYGGEFDKIVYLPFVLR